MDEVEVEAFRADTRASKGLTAAHIAEAASLYDGASNPAPLVFGHPTHDSPALGVISGARADGGKLFLKLRNIAEGVVTAVRERRILNRSVAFWAPDHPSNPHPGKYTIRHLGLLGGMAPAIPGMTPLRFSADDSALEPDGEEDHPPEAALVFRADAGTSVIDVIEPRPEEEPSTMPTAEELTAANARADAAEAEAARLRTAEETRQREFAAAEVTRRKTEDGATVDALVTAGQVLPTEAADLKTLFEALPTEALAFSAGQSEPRAALTTFLKALPKRAPGTGQQPITPSGGAPEFGAGSEATVAAETARKAAEEAQRNAWKGGTGASA